MRFLVLILCFCMNFSWGNDRSSSDENDPLLTMNNCSINHQIIIPLQNSISRRSRTESQDTIINITALPSYENLRILSNDMWLEIMLWLSIPDAKSLSLVCKEMNSVYLNLPSLKLKRHLWKLYGDYLTIITTYPDLFFLEKPHSFLTVDTFNEINHSLDKALETIHHDELKNNLQNLTTHIDTIARESGVIDSLNFLKSALDIPKRLEHYLQLCQDNLSYYISIGEKTIPERLLSFPLDDEEKTYDMSGKTDGYFCSANIQKFRFWGFYLIPTITLLTKFILTYPEPASILGIINETMFKDITKKLFIPRSCRESDQIWWVNRTSKDSSYYIIISNYNEYIYPPHGQGNYPNFISYIMNRYNLNETLWESLINKTFVTAPWFPREQDHMICNTDTTYHNLFCLDALHINAENDTGASLQTFEHGVNTECALASWKIAFSVFAVYTAFVFAVPKVSNLLGAMTYQFPTKKLHFSATVRWINNIIVVSYIVWLFYMFH